MTEKKKVTLTASKDPDDPDAWIVTAPLKKHCDYHWEVDPSEAWQGHQGNALFVRSNSSKNVTVKVTMEYTTGGSETGTCTMSPNPPLCGKMLTEPVYAHLQEPVLVNQVDVVSATISTPPGGAFPVKPAGDSFPVTVTHARAESIETPDKALWEQIRGRTQAISFSKFEESIDVLKDGHDKTPYPTPRNYNHLMTASGMFLEENCGVYKGSGKDRSLLAENKDLWERYVAPEDKDNRAIPYLALVRHRLGQSLPPGTSPKQVQAYNDALEEKLQNPCFIELIWSYWHEEGMLVQTMNALSLRFQNRRVSNGHDPLAQLELDPLRPLNNLLWGYIQSEIHRLSLRRRAAEYDHHYGLTLHGRAVSEEGNADSRSKFIEAFHHLLARSIAFYRQDDDTTVVADGFPVLNALKEVHFILAEGAHNQFGDLPWTARQEMLAQQWLLAQPPMQNFLGGRTMVPYPEKWMDRVDTMKSLMGWTDTSVIHFHDLAVFGEQVLLSVRFGNWSQIVQPQQATNWARHWRAEIQGYTHAYRTVTGVDLANPASPERVDATPPSVLLRRRLAAQLGR